MFTLPVSLEQVAALIKRMHSQDRQKLLAMVPELALDAIKHKDLLDDAVQIVEKFKQELIEEFGDQTLSPDEPFLGGLTLGQYFELAEVERAKLWDQFSTITISDQEEIEVNSDALSA